MEFPYPWKGESWRIWKFGKEKNHPHDKKKTDTWLKDKNEVG